MKRRSGNRVIDDEVGCRQRKRAVGGQVTTAVIPIEFNYIIVVLCIYYYLPVRL